MDITFLLNGEAVSPQGITPTTTLLDWLRDTRGLTGTKEGCNEGDCGACTVMVSDANGHRTRNGCILFLPQLNGKSVTTIEGLSEPDGTLHPAQRAMIDHHGSQCGFCTPGIVVSMATAHLNKATDHDVQLAGNLCRCTGYAPIIRAAQTIENAVTPPHLKAHPLPNTLGGGDPKGAGGKQPPSFAQPDSADALARWYQENPDGTLIAGATDVGLWVTKQHRALGKIAFLNNCADLQGITETKDSFEIGPMTTLTDLETILRPHHPSLAAMITRYGSVQVRNAATIGGNIANGSPIGDGSPALIALGAMLHLRQGDKRRQLPLEDFFVSYGTQDRLPGEFIENISVPKQTDYLFCHKISKRFDQDISAVCACLNIPHDKTTIGAPRLAFGGMAGTPKRAEHTERALTGQPLCEETFRAAGAALEQDFTPLSDARATASYRLKVAQNLLLRSFFALQGAKTQVHEVRP